MMFAVRLPYPGLRAFNREESDLFFGRESCVDTMVDRLAATRFLAVLGPSGSGKSSLVRTGLLDALDLGLHSWAGSRWQIADLHPGSQPLRNLSGALLEANGAPFEVADVELLATFLRHGPRSVAEWAAGGNLEAGANLLLLVDQFEELFRYGGYAQREEAEAFVSLLLESAEAPGARIHVVITMRSEYLGACTLIPGLAERINEGLYLTSRMSREECREAIEGPASVIGFKIAPALANRLLNDLMSFAPWEGDSSTTQLERLSRRADQLPLMQHVLNQLWVRAVREERESNVELQLADYERIGGLSGALDVHGAEVIASLSSDQARRVEAVFRALVSGPSLALAVRRPCPLGELVEVAGGAREDVVEVVEAFRAPHCNFIRTSGPSLGEDGVIVDISHESLIRQWKPLTRWLEQEARDDAEWRRLAAAEERFVQGEGGLLVGVDLHSLQAWWEAVQPNAVWASRYGGNFEGAQEFLAASRRAEEARTETQNRQEARERKRLRAGIAALAAALVIVIGMSIVAWRLAQLADARAREAKNNAQIAKENELKSRKLAYISMINEDRARESERKEKAYAQIAIAAREIANKSDTRSKRLIGAIQQIRDAINSEDLSNFSGMETVRGKIRSFEPDIDANDSYAVTQAGKSQAGKSAETPVDTAGLIKTKYRRAISAEQTGDALQAMRHYEEAYARGLQAINSIPVGQRPPDSLTAGLILDGVRYAWNLFDIANEKDAEKVRSMMKRLAGQYDVSTLPPALVLAFARLENMENRYYGDRNQREEADEHLLNATKLMQRAVEMPDATMEAMEFLVILYGNARKPDRNIQAKLCAVADRMLTANAMDKRAIRAHVDCLRYQPGDAKERLSFDKEKARLQEALDAIQRILRKEPDDQRALLDMADIETDIADMASWYGMEEQRVQYALLASDHFLKALRGRTLLQSYTSQVKLLYQRFQLSFSNSAEEMTFYRNMAEAVAPTLAAFPKAPSFAYVAGDAADHIGRLLYKDVERRRESGEYFARALKLFELSGIIDDTSSFSEDYAAYCGAFAHRIEFYAATRRADLMLRDLKSMESACGPIRDKYPWDFYLRQHFLASAKLAGEVLLNLGIYREAALYLTYSSHWGEREASKLLARVYHEGLGVKPSEERARELQSLAQSQGQMKRFSLPRDCAGAKGPFFVYARDWPEEYLAGVDDQITWLKEARGCTVAPEVSKAFRDLQKIARENMVPFTDLCVYAMGKAAQKEGDPKP